MPHQDPRSRLQDSLLYLCTDARSARGDLATFADAVLGAGVDIIQLRDKTAAGPLEAAAEIEELQLLGRACDRHGALLAVNDRADIAAAVNADVLHLGQDDLPVAVARRLLGDSVLIGRSTHDTTQADAAMVEAGVDYFCTGPTWATPTKPGRPAAGLQLLDHAAGRAAQRPWFAIGGIDEERLDQVLGTGADRVVVVRAITEAADPAAAAARIKARLVANSRGR